MSSLGSVMQLVSHQLARWPFRLSLYYTVLLIFPFSESTRMRFAHYGEHPAGPTVALLITSRLLAVCP